MRPHAHDDHQLGDRIGTHDDYTCVGNRLVEFIQGDDSIRDKKQTSPYKNLPIRRWVALSIAVPSRGDHADDHNDIRDHRDFHDAKIRVDHVESKSRQKVDREVDEECFDEIKTHYGLGGFLCYFEPNDVAYMGEQKCPDTIDEKTVPQKQNIPK